MPVFNPLRFVLGLEGVAMVPTPESSDHIPDPTRTVFADRLEVDAQIVWSGPASAVVGRASTCMFTWSTVDGQTPLLVVHLNTVTPPEVNPFTAEPGLLMEAAVPVPESVDQVPVPVMGATAFKVAVVMLQSVWSSPAFAVLGLASI